MAENPPVVFILHGEDEHGITQTIASLQASLGDPSMASMNITRLDGRSANMDELVNASFAGPFLCPRRLVILLHPLSKLAAKDNKVKFLAFLENVPATTILALVTFGDLGTWKGKTYYPHWLEEYANTHRERAKVKLHSNSPEEMVTKIYAMAKSTGAEINGPAAQELARLVGQDTMLASQEVEKLGAYVNYKRPITIEDVKLLVEDTAPANIFAMVEHLSAGKGKDAANLLQKLLEESDPLEIMGMIVRQFRFLLLAREALDTRLTEQEAVEALNLQKNQTWLARKYMEQARRYSMNDLVDIYHRLLDTDEAFKTGGMEPVLALDLLIAGLSGQKAALKIL
jgi:DNA polymerase III subunit delta